MVAQRKVELFARLLLIFDHFGVSLFHCLDLFGLKLVFLD